MKAIAMLIALMSLVLNSVSAQSSLFDVQSSHVDANVPSAKDFDILLTRDLLAYFKTSGAASVKYELLRAGPTQSGVSYPKYYLWARAFKGGKLVQEGAVRVAAIDKTQFEITTFLSKAAISTTPDQVGSVFPAALVPAVLSRAGVK